MKTKWFAVPETGEVSSYNIYEDGNTSMPRGTYLVYAKCCLITGMNSEEEAKESLKLYPCRKKLEA